MNSPIGAPIQERLLTSIALLWLAGVALRLTILAVPPVIPLIHDELNLSATQIGILTGLPSMLFAFAAVPGSLLVARLGISPALVVGLVLTAVGGALRGALPDVTWLYAMTVAMGAGVAIMQVTMPSAVRAWVPGRIGFATAVYTNGLLIGEILPVALMLPLVLPLVNHSWQWGFVVWSFPVAIIALVVMSLAPRPTTNGLTPVPVQPPALVTVGKRRQVVCGFEAERFGEADDHSNRDSTHPPPCAKSAAWEFVLAAPG